MADTIPLDASDASSCRHYLERATMRRDEIGAWAYLVPDDWSEARRPAGNAPLPLSGVSVGIKDIIDVAGMPTGCGTPVHAAHIAHTDAAIVAQLRDAGALIVGKTATAELAYLQPPVTRNPHDLSRSPGGSSSGSAAAVADRQVQVAIGTQTAGSVIRPASFCGVVGFKPGHEIFSRAGVKATARSLDCLGWMAADMSSVMAVWKAIGPVPESAVSATPGFAFCRTPNWALASHELQSCLLQLGGWLGVENEAALPPGLDALHHTIMKYEMRAELTTERLQFAAQLSAALRDFLADDPVPLADYRAAQAARARVDVDEIFGDADVLITPASTGEAVPFGSTGSPVFNRAWTLLGLPCLTLPFATGALGLPMGVQLVAKPGGDNLLLDAALMIEKRLRDREVFRPSNTR